MRWSVSEMAKLCGVSIRTLHYYDQIGLLCPETAADSGYRYDCTREVLAGLGAMYVEDDRFRENLDRFGAGTAELMAAAIGAYCEEK